MRLVVCSNSAPRWQEDVGLLPRSPGGLVPLLVALLGNGGDWVCTAPSSGLAGTAGSGGPPGEGVTVTELPGDVTLHQIHQPEPVIRQHYEDIGVRLMLWLFHYLLDTSREPFFDRQFASAWAGFEAVNQSYARYLATALAGSPDELVLVNDYHLFLLPELLGQTQRRPGQLVFFHGLPWCEPDYFGLLPAAIRGRILASLLHCDVVGFHCTRWARAFAACCARFLPGCEVTDDTVTYDRAVSGPHRTRLAVAPFPLDIQAMNRMRGELATADWQERLSMLQAGRRVIARADRMDLWKNLPRGFAAYESLLERNPELARAWWFCAVATTPSRTTERSRDLQRSCEATVARINERFGAPGRPAVSLVYPSLPTTRNCVVAALSESDLTLVNPTFDGMNLVAKEALYLGERAPVLLSRNAGAYEQLAGCVTPLQPFDVEATAAAMAEAMNGNIPARQLAGQRLLCGQDAGGWLAQLTGSAVTAGTGRQP